MAGVYFHVPFCTKACHYCDFHFSTKHDLIPDMVESMLQELGDRSHELGRTTIASIYFGGGTPSLLDPTDIRRFIESTAELGTLSADAEITLECNPEDLNPVVLSELMAAGVNRLSIGIQTYDDDTLLRLNRAHTAEQARNSLRWAGEAGFSNITADLILGLPGSSLESCRRDVAELIASGIPHVSAYVLTIEPRTVFHHRLSKSNLDLPGDENTAEQYQLVASLLADAGFEQYELSNHAKPGFRSKHNSSYWKGVPYIGIGPSAHSYDGSKRRWNVANNARYLKRQDWFGLEELTDRDRYNEAVMVGLRTAEGCDLKWIQDEFGAELHDHLTGQASTWMASGHLDSNENTLTLTDSGRLISDRIIEDLFQLDES